MNQIGINVFGLKELLHIDFEGTFHTLREIGFSAIEPMVVFPEANGMEPDRMEESLRTAGQDGAFWVSRMARQRIRWLREEGFAVHGAQLGLVGMAPGGLDAVLPEALRGFADYRMLIYAIVLIVVMLATNSPQMKALLSKLVPFGKKGEKEHA